MIAWLVPGALLALAFLVLLGRLSKTDNPAKRKSILLAAAPVGLVLLVLMLARGQFLPAIILAGSALWVGIGSQQKFRRAKSDQEEAAELLGVAPDAEEAEINKAFRKLMSRHHPDVGGDVEMAAKLNAARKCLLGK